MLQAVSDSDSPPSVPGSSALRSSSAQAAGNLAHGVAVAGNGLRPGGTAQQKEAVKGSAPQEMQVSLGTVPSCFPTCLGYCTVTIY